MRIEDVSGPRTGSPSRVRRRQSGFSLPDAATIDEPGGPAAAHQATSLVGIVAAGALEAAHAPGSDREAASHGEKMLDALGGLQLAMLGQASEEALHALDRLSKEAPRAGTPGLQGILDAISVRVAVERERLSG